MENDIPQPFGAPQSLSVDPYKTNTGIMEMAGLTKMQKKMLGGPQKQLKNIIGISDQEILDNISPFNDPEDPATLEEVQTFYGADGGRVGLFMGGSPLTGEALAIYNSMNSYGYTDQDIADKLLSLNLYTPPGTTPPPGTPPPGTPPPGGNNGGNGGGDGGAGTTTKTTTTDPNTFNADTFDDKTIIDKFIYDRPYNMRDVAGDGLTTTTTSKNAFEETAPTTSVLEEIISSNKPNMLDVAGEELPVNEDIIDRANITNDPRIVSEELGITGFGKPNMKDVAGKELAGTTAPSIEKAISTFSRPTMADVANDLEKGPITMENIGAPDIPSNYDNFGQFGLVTLLNLVHKQ